ncbi:hemolysin family protein [Gulosibacter sediminis]|uniref:hemolysin family protein n=1 Tax=Gulosibacter sediminis TaxID=1729695 RepID=UPI0024A7C309|nr:hemolysin family protein [Gulosibacter sediminis]
MSGPLVVLITILLIVGAALLAAVESAIAVLSRADVVDEAEAAHSPDTLRRIGDNMSGHREAVGFARIGAETLATVLISVWFATLVAGPWLAFLFASLLMLAVHVLFTGSTPRTIGRTHPRDTLRMLGWLARGCRVVFGPISDLLGTLGDIVTPSQKHRHATVSSEEQLLSMVDAATEQEVLDEDDRELIHSVFDFSDRLVREVMVARTDMLTVDADDTVHDGLRSLLEVGISRAPIVGRDSDDIRGIAYQKDLARHLLEHPESTLRVASLARPPVFVPESLAADTLLRRMQRDSTHFAMVVDEYGGIAGLVTLEDLIEELVGEISDEFDRGGDEYERLEDGTLVVSSRMNITDLGELLDIDLEHEDVDSVGGLLTTALGRIPQLGDHAEIGGLALLADRVGRRHRVTRIQVRVLAPHSTNEKEEAA